MSDMVKNVALRMHNSERPHTLTEGEENILELLDNSEGVSFLDLARVAIEAMREPTDEMVLAAHDAGDKRDHVRLIDSRADAVTEWRAMIDEALK